MELNAEQIIKAFEVCRDKDLCNECPYEENIDCLRLREKHAIALMRSQEQRIKELTEENDKLKVVNHLLEGDIADRDKMLENKVEDVYAEFMRDYKCKREELEGAYEMISEAKLNTKADTVRKMQERLHERFKSDANLVYSNYNIHRYIDQIAKEMLEGNDDNT